MIGKGAARHERAIFLHLLKSINHKNHPRVPQMRSFRSANVAQECHNVGFVVLDGQFEGGLIGTAERRVNGEEHHERAQQAVLQRTWCSQPHRLSLI
jgi:hypothetical protein